MCRNSSSSKKTCTFLFTQQTKEELIKKTEKGVISDDNDEWDIDFEKLEKSINEKTKILIINSPHNPIGKVFTN